MLASLWAKGKAEECEAAGDVAGAKAYRNLEAMWRQREDEKRAKQSCVCGKSPDGTCRGICATGD